MDATWAAAEPLLPVGGDDHPLGCHNPRIADRVCFEGILIRLVTGCSWVTAERLIAHVTSPATPTRWPFGPMTASWASKAAGSIHKAPCGRHKPANRWIQAKSACAWR